MTHDQMIQDICKRLKPLIGNRADRLWHVFITSDAAAQKAEMAAVIQQLGLKHLGRDVDGREIFLPPPSEMNCIGDFPLGVVHYGNKPLYALSLRRSDLVKHVGIFAITGAGKTNIGLNLLLSLLRADIPFLVFDWKRSYRDIRSVSYQGTDRVRVISVGRNTASRFLWNPLRPPPRVHPQTWLTVIAETLEKSHVSGQGVADIFIELLDALFESRGAYDGTMEQYPTFHDARELMEKKQYSGRRQLWRDSCSRILRTFTFGPAAESFNARDPARIEDLLDGPVILELDQELPKPLRVFFCDIVLRWIHLYRLGQGESDTLRHVTVLEEAHNLFPRTSSEFQATNSLETIYREIRGFGEGLVCITQHPSLLPIYILGNCNTQIYLGLQHEDDIRTAKESLFLGMNEVKYLDYLNVGEGIVKCKGRFTPCFVRFPLVPILKGSVSDTEAR